MKKIYIGLLSLFLNACHMPASNVLEGPGGRNAYNIEIQKTNSEEMLLNLVRLRYYDTPLFLQVSSVTSSFTFKNSASALFSFPGFNKTNPTILGGETLWQNQPTIQYQPLQGQEFANQLMKPLDVSTIQQVIYAGWDVYRVFRLAVQNFLEYHNNPKEKELIMEKNPRYKNFIEVIILMNKLQENGDLQIGVLNSKSNENGCALKSIQFAFNADNEDSKKLAELLNITTLDNDMYVLNVTQGFDKKGRVGILPRSILSCMNNLSHNVIIPDKDIEDSIAIDLSLDKSSNSQNIMSIYSSSIKPKNPYAAIKYRDLWFYIKDCDLSSKRTFMLLLELYNLQSAKVIDTGPVLTLPVGVG
ncbi:MAG: hypothetical protein K1060chlam5_00294 [Candidatus Anoxychlamydiales bacterium]|nr:hypothetical protein [Candidatus Anoxychlamydiales bacterium]